MTERTIKQLAMAYAGQYYEERRSRRFRDGKDFVPVYQSVKDPETGQLVQRRVLMPFKKAYPTPHAYALAYWPVFYDAARKSLANMLGMEHVHEHMKKAIMDALVEDREKDLEAQARGQAKHLMQIAPNSLTGMDPSDIVSKENR